MSRFFCQDQSGGQTDIAIPIAWLITFRFIDHKLKWSWSPEDCFSVFSFLFFGIIGLQEFSEWVKKFDFHDCKAFFLQHHKHVLPIPLFKSILLTRSLLLIVSSTFIKGAIHIFLLCPHNLPSSCYHNNLRYFKMPEKHMSALRKKANNRAKCHG